MKPRKVWIIGAGLAGSITARLCRSAGHEVSVIDGGRPYSGSKAAACLLSPRWLSSLNGYQQAMAYATLRKIAPMKQLDFGNIKLDWVDPAHLLVKPDFVQDIVGVQPEALIGHNDGYIVRGSDLILVAAGIYCQELLPQIPNIKPVMGTALKFKGTVEPSLKMWAPFKQAIAFNIAPNKVWFGDGNAILFKNFSDRNMSDTMYRASKYMGLDFPHETIVGARPKMEGHKNGYLENYTDNIWVMTGGYKNGTALYALMAKRFLEEACQ